MQNDLYSPAVNTVGIDVKAPVCPSRTNLVSNFSKWHMVVLGSVIIIIVTVIITLVRMVQGKFPRLD